MSLNKAGSQKNRNAAAQEGKFVSELEMALGLAAMLPVTSISLAGVGPGGLSTEEVKTLVAVVGPSLTELDLSRNELQSSAGIAIGNALTAGTHGWLHASLVSVCYTT